MSRAATTPLAVGVSDKLKPRMASGRERRSRRTVATGKVTRSDVTHGGGEEAGGAVLHLWFTNVVAHDHPHTRLQIGNPRDLSVRDEMVVSHGHGELGSEGAKPSRTARVPSGTISTPVP